MLCNTEFIIQFSLIPFAEIMSILKHFQTCSNFCYKDQCLKLNIHLSLLPPPIALLLNLVPKC